MAVLDPGDLLEQAERLIQPPPAGPPLQVDIRRAISSSYYSVFPSVLAAAADEFVGKMHRSNKRYAHVYRSIEHSRLRKVCDDARRSKPFARPDDDLAAYGFGKEIRDFAEWSILLQEARTRADYDPRRLLKTADARAASAMARDAMRSFKLAADDDRKALLTLLLCQSRRGS